MDNLRKTYPGAGFAYDREWMELKPEGFYREVQILPGMYNLKSK